MSKKDKHHLRFGDRWRILSEKSENSTWLGIFYGNRTFEAEDDDDYKAITELLNKE